MTSNSKKQSNQEFCRNTHLEEQGFSPCPFLGIVDSPLETIPFENKKGLFYKLFVKGEYIGRTSQYFWAKGFSRYEDEEWLKEMLKPGAKVKLHGVL